MQWIDRINGTIEYIEEHLDDEISYDELEKIVGCSIYNFQRMFSYIADKPLSEYICARRLTVAAFDIVNGNSRILDVAVLYGYECVQLRTTVRLIIMKNLIKSFWQAMGVRLLPLVGDSPSPLSRALCVD